MLWNGGTEERKNGTSSYINGPFWARIWPKLPGDAGVAEEMCITRFLSKTDRHR